MQWIFDNISIVAVIAFFILSFLGKMGKSTSEDKPNRMPTFGGGGDPARQGPKPVKSEHSGQQFRPVQSRPGAPASMDTPSNDLSLERVDDPYAYEQERTIDNSFDHDGHIEMYSELEDPHEERDSMEKRKRDMQAELDLIHKQLDRMTSHIPETTLEVTDTDGNTKKQQSQFAKQAVNGIIWSEILGPPRSKRPMGRRS
ncbi:hypothetical protein [Paenibacillus dakarensis]|uniref:hypothetical protein n=1 Tax=Paenibacillus dakarensis TaxID=1527293 RepID=UPI0006D5A83C|nr:hypothetical protein [Paenibacillus dakarensis]